LTDQPWTPRTKRGAYGELGATLCLPCQHQVRDVGTGDQKHQGHRAEHEEQRAPHSRLERRVGQPLDTHAPVRVRRRKLLLQSAGHGAHVVSCLLERHATAQPSDNPQRVVAAVLPRRIDRHRQEDLRACCPGGLRPSDFAERLRHHADDLIAFAVERNRAPDDPGVAAKPRSPQ
jgi:hypothetical protein